MDQELVQRILALRDRIVANFDAGDWEEAGLLSGSTNLIVGHDRLLRSMAWGDQDYAGNVLTVLRLIAGRDPSALDSFDRLLDKKYPEKSTYISAKPSEKKLTFAPHVFTLPDVQVERDLVAIMMDFDAAFDPVHEAIKVACRDSGFRCQRADDIWEESVIMQDVFNLLFRANVVVVDFTGRNSNVMYETGIAHTLGKLVIPITQSMGDVPFDVKHHRALQYLRNTEGLNAMTAALAKKLAQVSE